jgi:hypothetical protein
MKRIRQMLLLSACLLLGLLLGGLLPARPSGWLGRMAAADRQPAAVAGYLPSSAHLTLFDDEDLVFVPLIIKRSVR